MVELIEEYGAVSFETIVVEDKSSMLKLLRILDNAIGYVPQSEIDDWSSIAFGSRTIGDEPGEQGGGLLAAMPGLDELGDVDDVQERWGPRKAEYDAKEVEGWEKEWEGRKKMIDRLIDTQDFPPGHTTSVGAGERGNDFRDVGRRAMDSSEPAATVIRAHHPRE